MLRTPYVIAAGIVCIGIVGVLVAVAQTKSSVAATVPTRIANVPIVLLNGESATVGVVREGRPMVVNSWASWCPYCRTELPELEQLANEFNNTVVVLAINRGEDAVVGTSYLKNINVPGRVVYAFDPSDAWYRVIGGYVMPETLFIRADGTVMHHQRGVMALPALREKVVALLREEGGSPAEATVGQGKGCTGALCAGEE